MVDERSSLRETTWRDFYSWIGFLGRSVRLATALRVLLLAFLGILGTVAGWRLIGLPFDDEAEDSAAEASAAMAVDPTWADPYSNRVQDDSIREELTEAALDARLERRIEARKPWPGERREMAVLPGEPISTAERSITGDLRNPLFHAWAWLTDSFHSMFVWDISWKEFLYLLLCGLWALFMWSFFGGAISRITALSLTREDRLGMFPAISYARRRWLSYFSAPLFPLIGVLLAAIPMLIVGLLFHFDVGVVLAAILWPLVLLGALVMAVILVGLLFGWPLMWATISTEGTDSFDAMSRSYAYVFQRPLQYFIYVVVASILGSLGLLVVSLLVTVIENMAWWSVGWGAGLENVRAVQNAMLNDSTEDAISAGANFIEACNWLLWMLPLAFAFAYFWTASTAIYLLLRYHVDQTELDEISVEEEAETYGLPPVRHDAAGVPTVADVPPTTPASTTEPGSTQPSSPPPGSAPPGTPPTLPGDDIRHGPPV